MIGGDGLTPAVQKEVDAALNAHGLIKVRVFSDDRAAREAVLRWRFRPVQVNGVNVEARGLVPIRFDVRQG